MGRGLQELKGDSVLKSGPILAICSIINIVDRFSGPIWPFVPLCMKWPSLLDLGTLRGT